MFKEFFLFEIQYRLKRPMIYIFLGINFLLLFAATISESVQIGGGNDAVHINSPHVIMSTVLLMTLIGIFMTTAFMNTSILRDFDYQYDGILFSTPISKAGYLGGRFLGATLMALVPFLGVLAGIALGSASPWVEANEVGPFYPMAYWSTFFIGVIPNTFLISSIVFMLAALFRSSLFSFIGAMGVLIFYIMMLSFSQDLDSEYIAIISDPLAINSYDLLTKYWTIEEKNTQWIAFSGPILINRLLWFLVSILFLSITYFRFSFARRKAFFQRKNKMSASNISDFSPVPSKLKTLPNVQTQSNAASTWQQFLHQSNMEFWGIAKSTPFIVLLAFGLINMLSAIPFAENWFGTGNHPVTYLIVEAIRNSLYLFVIGIVMYYSGVVIWRERDAQMNEFFDAAPFPTWIPFSSKLVAVVGITASILVLAIICGVGFQALSGYFQFEWSVYFREFLVYDLLKFTSLIILSMLVQTLVNNKYLGYFAFILLLVVFKFGPQALDIQSNLVSFGSTPNYIYSDMNAWSLFARGLAWFHGYWILFAALLGVFSILFWVRGQSLTWPQRWTIARQRFSGPLAKLTLLLGLVWLSTGGFLYYQTKVLNEITDEEVMELEQVSYEQKYKQYQHLAQPRITDIDYDIAIYPQERNYTANTIISAKNKTEETISQIHFTLPEALEVTLEIPNAQLKLEDTELSYQIYQLAQPLAPGESITFRAKMIYTSQGIENEVSHSEIINNGTFLTNYKLLPAIGYSPGMELSDKKKRAEHGLAYKPRVEKLHQHCTQACHNTYISNDADWVNVSSTISTSKDQIAIAPGTLTKEWEENDRRYFKYQLKKPVLNFYSFISGRYEVAREKWMAPDGKEVDVEVYFHPGHDYNVDKMLGAVKQSLEYYSSNYLPYPHEQARIVEFPRYESFAQAFPGTMPYSESIGFISNLQEEDAIDMVYYVVAHEMAHQWWAHQIIGADVQGATMLSETFSQYGALMVMQAQYGKDKMKQFMKYEMDKYLRSRGQETEKELPLMYNENQAYIHYRKGSVVMYALQDYIGEDSLNKALRRYAEAVAYQEAPYTTTLDVMNYISDVTPDSLQYLLDDMFRNITLYSNKTTEATFQKQTDGRYEVIIAVSTEKFYADSLGRETPMPLNDFIDIGIFSAEKEVGEKYGRPILIERHRISGRDTSFTFMVDELPFEAGIDPNYLLIDRFPEDNVKKLVEQ